MWDVLCERCLRSMGGACQEKVACRCASTASVAFRQAGSAARQACALCAAPVMPAVQVLCTSVHCTVLKIRVLFTTHHPYPFTGHCALCHKRPLPDACCAHAGWVFSDNVVVVTTLAQVLVFVAVAIVGDGVNAVQVRDRRAGAPAEQASEWIRARTAAQAAGRWDDGVLSTSRAVGWCCLISCISFAAQASAGVLPTPVSRPCSRPSWSGACSLYYIRKCALLCAAVWRGARRRPPELGGGHQPAGLLGAGRAAGRVAGVPAAPGRVWALGRAGDHHLLAGAHMERREPALTSDSSVSKAHSVGPGMHQAQRYFVASIARLSPLESMGLLFGMSMESSRR